MYMLVCVSSDWQISDEICDESFRFFFFFSETVIGFLLYLICLL